ncbi:hypothetical protein HPB49_026056 [Dermacentor silvarum]|nr:hypothetical protein HPB49_026056 [Dermacentor silvarum]
MLAPSEDELSFGWQCFRDVSASTGDTVVLRSDLGSEENASEWVKRYSEATDRGSSTTHKKKADAKRLSVTRSGGVISITTTKLLHLQHNHPIESAAALRLLRCNDETKALFEEYFSAGLTPAEAIRLHESTLSVEGDAASLVRLASGALNPTKRAVYYLYEKWRQEHYGTVCDPFTKLQKKIPGYAALEADVTVNTTPLLSKEGRYELGKLALGDRWP